MKITKRAAISALVFSAALNLNGCAYGPQPEDNINQAAYGPPVEMWEDSDAVQEDPASEIEVDGSEDVQSSDVSDDIQEDDGEYYVFSAEDNLNVCAYGPPEDMQRND